MRGSGFRGAGPPFFVDSRRVIVPKAEIDLVVGFRRRMMRLPVARVCPVKLHRPYKLQTKANAKGQVTITVVEIRKEPLEALSLADARREGYAGVQGALEGWRRAHGVPVTGQMVWVIRFLLGDRSQELLTDEPVYLSKYGSGFTTIQAKQAVPGDPEVMPALPGTAEQARIVALARRQAPQRGSIVRIGEEVETLRESLVSMKSRNRARLIQRELAKLQSELPVSEIAAG